MWFLALRLYLGFLNSIILAIKVLPGFGSEGSKELALSTTRLQRFFESLGFSRFDALDLEKDPKHKYLKPFMSSLFSFERQKTQP